MRTLRTAIQVVLGLAAICLGAVAWHQYLELIPLRAAQDAPHLLSDTQRLEKEDAQVDRLRQRLAEVEKRQAADAAIAKGPAWRNTPEAQALLTSAFRYRMSLEIDREYGPLLKKLNLTPEQVAQFKQLIEEKREAVMDTMAAAREAGVAPGTPDYRQAVAEAAASMDQQIEALMGADAFAQFQQYDATLPERNAVNLVPSMLAQNGAALSPDQIDQLTAAFAANRPPYDNQRPGYIMGTATASISGSDVRSAATILDPTQESAVQDVRQDQIAQRQMQQTIYLLQHGTPVSAFQQGQVHLMP